MKKQNLILILTSILLITIISVEIVYLTTLNKNTTDKNFQEEIAMQEDTLRIPSEDDLTKERSFNKLIDDVEKGYIDDAILSTYYAGSFLQYEILSSAQDQRYVGGMRFSIQVDTKEQNNITNVIIPAKVVSSMKVLRSVSNQLVPATIDDIKTGTIIRIQQDQKIIETDPVEAITNFTITIE
ncbi:hypothetical protein COY16_05460 [Candidatus Roizmanbacteria bacterium CG_4_10_14_0_2_um_filter_39_13]|uniref:Uncharacterized protein n=1 Tax=Candidatus Roizmanbacteria bacterium CG_4_10_14_0_2_um_filter_39_13 TaxID=1974825 RepID=A0A2M7TWM3_9BACT|nr:MAG: hypothetical protein COY16_05460 [Candidatus Roizmanbacteria bacterium CG_4_10_14_0_2_um_filter_39_13]